MSQELLYTSVPRGLRTGEHGFCTVAATRGIPASLATKLESLCAYRHLYPPSDPRAELNPVNFAHLRLQLEGKIYHVLSRVGDAGLDYSQRTNKLAHHVALDRTELPPGGPAHALLQRGFMETEWGERPPQVLDSGRRPRAEDAQPRVCKHWEQITGDAGWAGYLAGLTTGRPVYLIFRPGVDPLPLIAEANALLPAPQRWNVTFSTYYTGLPPDVPCQWRCVVAESPEANAALESGAPVILLEPGQDAAPDGPLVEAARTGRVPREAPEAKPTRASYPVSAPAPMAQRFPIAPALAMNEPATLEPISEESLPMLLADPPAAPARSGGTIWLILGLALGLVLMFLCVLPIELLTGKSIPGAAGLASRAEEEMKAKIDSLDDDLKKERVRSQGLERDLENERKRVADRPAPKVPDKTPENERPRWPWIIGGSNKSDADKAKELADAKKRIEELQEQNKDLARQIADLNQKLKDAMERAPAAPKPAGAGASPPIPTEKPSVEAPLQLPAKVEAPRPVALSMKNSAGGRLELLGLPTRVADVAMKATATEEGEVRVLADDRDFCSFRRSISPDAAWQFEWGRGTFEPSVWPQLRDSLSRCVLKLTRKGDASTSLYPLQQSETPIVCKLKLLEANEPTFQAKLGLHQESLADPSLGEFVLGKLAVLTVANQQFALKKDGDHFVTRDKDQPPVELRLDGDVLRLKFVGATKAPVVNSLRVDLSRNFRDVAVQVAVIRATGPN